MKFSKKDRSGRKSFPILGFLSFLPIHIVVACLFVIHFPYDNFCIQENMLFEFTSGETERDDLL